MIWVKSAFIVLLVLFLFPSNGQESFLLYTTAQRTITDLAGFCDRNPDVCENVANAFQRMLEKLKSATDSIEYMLQDAGIGAGPQDNYTGYEDGQGSPTSSLTPSPSSDTLTDTDRGLSWRGPDET
jgi:hypothetical protein